MNAAELASLAYFAYCQILTSLQRSIPGNLQILTIDGHGLPDGHDFGTLCSMLVRKQVLTLVRRIACFRSEIRYRRGSSVSDAFFGGFTVINSLFHSTGVRLSPDLRFKMLTIPGRTLRSRTIPPQVYEELYRANSDERFPSFSSDRIAQSNLARERRKSLACWVGCTKC